MYVVGDGIYEGRTQQHLISLSIVCKVVSHFRMMAVTSHDALTEELQAERNKKVRNQKIILPGDKINIFRRLQRSRWG